MISIFTIQFVEYFRV